MDQAPPSLQDFAQIRGWMTMELFKKYMEHFCKIIKPTINKSVLLIPDGRCSHTKSTDVLHYASQNGVVMLAQPPHTTHRLQPLDVGFFKPLQTYYDQFIERWLLNHPRRTIYRVPNR